MARAGEVLGPLAAVLSGREPRGVRRLEVAMPKYVPAFDRTLAEREARSCADALTGAIDLYRELRDAAAVDALIRRSEAEQASTMYLTSIGRRVL